MKLTWFGGTALRAYVGGEIVVIDPDTAPDAVDRGELLAGADRIVAAGDPLPQMDPASWRARPAPRPMDDVRAAEVARMEDALIVAAAGEPTLVIILGDGLPRFGRWAEGAVIVLTSAREGLVAEVTALLDVARPKLIGLAVDVQALDRVVAELAEHLDGVSLASLEPGLALEV